MDVAGLAPAEPEVACLRSSWELWYTDHIRIGAVVAVDYYGIVVGRCREADHMGRVRTMRLPGEYETMASGMRRGHNRCALGSMSSSD